MFRCLRLRKQFFKYSNYKKWFNIVASLQRQKTNLLQVTEASGTSAQFSLHLLALDTELFSLSHALPFLSISKLEVK